MYAVRVALRLRWRCDMKIAPRTPVLLSGRPVAALPTAEARRPTARPLTPARGDVRERTVLFAGGMAARGPEAAAPIAPARPTDRPVSSAPGDRPVLTSPPGRAEAAGGAKPLPGFHGAVTEFKRRLIETTLTELGGNRTRAARALGLQRTYLLRLMREFAVHVPAGTVPPRRGAESPGTAPAPPR
jgi:Bacterial regulatory protein, Fis family